MKQPSPDDMSLPGLTPWQRASAGTHLLVSVVAGLMIGIAVGPATNWATGALVASTVAASVFLLWTWTSIWPLDAVNTARLAQREDPSRAVRDIVLLVVAAGSLLTVALVIFPAHKSGTMRVMLGIACLVVSWAVVHTVFTLKYARLYYTEPTGGLDFNQEGEPRFRDFAYIAFTIGMTFQVSDTEVRETLIRTTILRHALISFLFTAIIIAVTINLIAGLSR
jgi:uncharacterized membrane protein